MCNLSNVVGFGRGFLCKRPRENVTSKCPTCTLYANSTVHLLRGSVRQKLPICILGKAPRELSRQSISRAMSVHAATTVGLFSSKRGPVSLARGPLLSRTMPAIRVGQSTLETLRWSTRAVT